MTIQPYAEIPVRGNWSKIFQWVGLKSGDTGEPFPMGSYSDKTIQVEGNFSGGASVSLEGTNNVNKASPVYFTLHKTDLSHLTFSSPDGFAIIDNPHMIRPNVSGGDGSTDITVSLYIISNSNRI